MDNENSSIKKILKAEKESEERLSLAKNTFEEKLTEYEKTLGISLEEFENQLRKKGKSQLKTVQAQASTLAREKITEAEGKKNEIIKTASTKKEDATENILNAFLQLIR